MSNIFSTVSYFSRLSSDELLAVEQSAIRKTYQPNEIVLLEGNPEGGLHIVESGWLKVYKLSQGGREQVLSFLGPGEIFNGVSVFTESANQASVIAMEEAVVWCINRSGMRELLNNHPLFAQNIIRDLAGRLQHLVGLVEDLSLRTIESRLARTLLDETVNTAVPRRKWATQTEMASRLGTVPDVLNRALRKLVEENLIEVTRHQIRIIDSDGLRRKIESE